MKAIYCDICGKKIDKYHTVDTWNKDMFADMSAYPIEDVCEECFKIIYCCVNMMKETKWKPNFHEVLKSENAFSRDVAGHILSNLEEKTGLEF